MVRDLELSIDDPLESLLLAGATLERSISESELEYEDAQAPHIDPLVIEIALHNLRGHVVEGATESLPLAAIRLQLLEGGVD